MKIILPPNTLSEWYELVKDTEAHTGLCLDDHVKNYLILTLDNFVRDEVLIDLPIAIEYLESICLTKGNSSNKLRIVGDRCLILSGFFPEHAKHLNVNLSYFVDIGRRAYLTLADRSNIRIDPNLFYKLSSRFLDLTELLMTMRQLASGTPKH